MAKTKICPKCKTEKPTRKFKKHTSYCIECNKIYRRELYAKKRQTTKNTHPNYSYKTANRLRICLSKAMIRKSKNTYMTMLLGVSIREFRQHIKSLFENGMGWDNYGMGYGKWQLDHIIPCSNFDFTDIESMKDCFHWTNMRPMWATDNLGKSAKSIDKKAS